MATSPLKIGIVGAGNIAMTAHLPVLSCIPDVRVSYIADIHLPLYTPKGISKILLQNDPSILPDCDVALLAAPVGAREPYVREFSRRHIPIFSEKPFAPDTMVHERFLNLAQVIGCNYMRTCYSSVQQLRELFASGVLGRLRSVSISEGGIVGKTKKGKDHYQANAAMSGGGILMESGCHTLSQLCAILPEHKLHVLDAAVVYDRGFDVDARVRLSAVCRTQRIPIAYHISLIEPVGMLSRYDFENASVTFNHTAPESPLAISRDGSQFNLAQNKMWATTFYQAFYIRWKQFLTAVRNHEQIAAAQETSLQTTKIITEVYTRTR